MRENENNKGIVQILRENAIYLFIGGFFLINIYTKFIGLFNFLTGLPTQRITYVYYGVLWLLLAIYVCLNFKKAFPNFLMVLFFALMISGSQYLLFPENAQYIWNFDFYSIITFSSNAFFNTALFTVIGLAVEDREKFCNVFHKFARFGVIVAAFTYLLLTASSFGINYDDMVYAYTICFFVCFLIAVHKKHDMFFILIGTVCVFIAGTRGPLVCIIIAALLKHFIMKKRAKKVGGFVVAGVATLLVVITDSFGFLINKFGDFLASLGFTDLRIIDYFNAGDLSDSSGRSDLYKDVIGGIFKKPFFGYGLGGDRIIVGGDRIILDQEERYSHNIILEILASFGIFIGVVFIILLAVAFFKSMYSKSRHMQMLSITFFSAVIIQLMFSSTMLNSKALFVFIGMYIVYRRSEGNHILQTDKDKELGK